MPASTLIFNPNLEQGEPSRASRIAARVKQKVRQGRTSVAAREVPSRDQERSELGREGKHQEVEQDFARQALDVDLESNPETLGERDLDASIGQSDYFPEHSAENSPKHSPEHLAEHSPNAGPRTGWSDVALVQAFQVGDERAFAELYTRRKREIYTFCVRMLGGDRDLANDAFQETFIKVYDNGYSFRSGTNVMGWLFMIARNTCLNLLRSKRTTETLDEQRALVSYDRSLGPEFGEEQHYLRELLERAIAALPDEFREPFILREFDGFSYGEIAKLTGVSLPTTKVRIYRAKLRLRELLQPYLESDELESERIESERTESEQTEDELADSQYRNTNRISILRDMQECDLDIRSERMLDTIPEEE